LFLLAHWLRLQQVFKFQPFLCIALGWSRFLILHMGAVVRHRLAAVPRG